MKKEVAEKWVAALRSGDYEQGKYSLRNASGQYCCLGVLCEITGVKKTGTDEEGATKYGDSNGYLPPSASKLSGIDISNGSFNGKPVRWPDSIPQSRRASTSLTTLNDQGVPFSAIADFIEVNWPVL